ncbi:hypothetical protein RO3G_07223 [Rhizopus delemar RA 99-880]|uniref:Uncharacterized protein n=3 Tax=Rhizopus TaxID=4842 RepID=I1C238_RHIO9|nr:hypothetical protein RO3G_07223 [Rhizopus delemar RA 99-880]|eukprot:EIE82518.1 hypothetical protein RO3G_07223 [Rhizopus delemar RA 99-880]
MHLSQVLDLVQRNKLGLNKSNDVGYIDSLRSSNIHLNADMDITSSEKPNKKVVGLLSHWSYHAPSSTLRLKASISPGNQDKIKQLASTVHLEFRLPSDDHAQKTGFSQFPAEITARVRRVDLLEDSVLLELIPFAADLPLGLTVSSETKGSTRQDTSDDKEKTRYQLKGNEQLNELMDSAVLL